MLPQARRTGLLDERDLLLVAHRMNTSEVREALAMALRARFGPRVIRTALIERMGVGCHGSAPSASAQIIRRLGGQAQVHL
jgi:hypothetical protein